MGSPGTSGDRVGMTQNRMISPSAEHVDAGPPVDAATRLTGADFDALRLELDALRSRHRAELEQSLRDARMFGSPADDDERLAALEQSVVAEARIARLEMLLRSASIVEDAGEFDGRAAPGCTVWVADEDGREIDYLLVGRHHHDSVPRSVSIASPVGTALIGARAGEVVEVELPSGRRRSLVVLDVRPGPAGARAA
jgi:transcription elongation factor GreA